MATDFKTKYGTSNQPITITLTSLANNGQQGSDAIDNSTNLHLGVFVFVEVKSNTTGTVTSGYVNVYVYGTADGGTTYSDGVSGSNGGVTLTNPPNLRLLGVINVVANATVYGGGPFDIAAAFDGEIPEKWGIVVENKSGATLDASVGGAWFQGILKQGV